MVPSRHLEYVLHTYMYIHNRGVKLKVPKSRYREKEKERQNIREKKERETERERQTQKKIKRESHILMRETVSTIKHMVEGKEEKRIRKNDKYIYILCI